MAFNGPEWVAELLDEPVDSWGVMYDFEVSRIEGIVPRGWHAYRGTLLVGSISSASLGDKVPLEASC
jgi:hypothetical protein